MWPFRRRRGAEPDGAAAAHPGPGREPPAAPPSEPAWQQLPPLPPVAPIEPTTRPARFEADLATRAAPSLSGPMEHVVSPESPAGTVDGLATVIDRATPADPASHTGPGPQRAPGSIADLPWRPPVSVGPATGPSPSLVEAPAPPPTRRLAAVPPPPPTGAARPIAGLQAQPTRPVPPEAGTELPTPTPATAAAPGPPAGADHGEGDAGSALPDPSPDAPAPTTRPLAPPATGDVATGPAPGAGVDTPPSPPRPGLGAPLAALPDRVRERTQRAPLLGSGPTPASGPTASPTPATSVPQAVRDAVARSTGGAVPDAPVRRGPEAGADAHRLQARAFTSEGTVHLPDEAGPADRGEGAALLAHELTHAAQQEALGDRRPPESSAGGQALEAQAVRAESLARGDSGPPPTARPIAGAAQGSAATTPGPQRAPWDSLGSLGSVADLGDLARPSRPDVGRPDAPGLPSLPDRAGALPTGPGLDDLGDAGRALGDLPGAVPELRPEALPGPTDGLDLGGLPGAGDVAGLVGRAPSLGLARARPTALGEPADRLLAARGALPGPDRDDAGGTVRTLAERGLGSVAGTALPGVAGVAGLGGLAAPGGVGGLGDGDPSGLLEGLGGPALPALPSLDLPSVGLPSMDLPGPDLGSLGPGPIGALGALGGGGGGEGGGLGGGLLSQLPFAGPAADAVGPAASGPAEGARSAGTDVLAGAGSAAGDLIGSATNAASGALAGVTDAAGGALAAGERAVGGAVEDAGAGLAGLAGMGADELDHVVERMMPRITSRLERELRRQRERAGRLTGL